MAAGKKLGRIEGCGELKASAAGSFSASHGEVDPSLTRRNARAIKLSRQEDADSQGTNCCLHTACIANVTGCCSLAKKPRAEIVRHMSSGQKAQTIPRHRTIFHPKEWSEYVPIICDGWATYSIVGTDGRRQILSFRLPGDIISTAWLCDSVSDHTVEAVTQVTYRKFERKCFITMLLDIPDLREKLLRVLSNELAHAERVAFAVGRRRAEERIARLIVRLSERLPRYGMMQGQTMEFPLRQRDIADATGLTHDHVGKILGSFQRGNLIKISGQLLTIIDQPGLRNRALPFFHWPADG